MPSRWTDTESEKIRENAESIRAKRLALDIAERQLNFAMGFPPRTVERFERANADHRCASPHDKRVQSTIDYLTRIEEGKDSIDELGKIGKRKPGPKRKPSRSTNRSEAPVLKISSKKSPDKNGQSVRQSHCPDLAAWMTQRACITRIRDQHKFKGSGGCADCKGVAHRDGLSNRILEIQRSRRDE